MNERIKELAEQAGCTIDGMGYGEGNVEKFAELIVKECINLVDDEMYKRSWRTPLEIGRGGPVSNVLKEHFGGAK